MGRWSRAAAGPFLEWLDLPAGARWLDVGCGTGALTGEILGRATPSVVLGLDRSSAFAAYAAGHVPDPAPTSPSATRADYRSPTGGPTPSSPG
jgi:ubiquinone/menaquinone biosynthesis C-methylase UbiE